MQIKINRTLYQSHRLAWLYINGKWPENQIDHINHNRTDNRIENLRLATNSENSRNRKLQCNNSTGLHGVTWRKDNGKWRVRINIEGDRVNIGNYRSLFEAACARKSAELMYGYHENHGR